MFSILLVSHGSVASSMIKSSGMLLGYREGIYAVEIDAYTVVDNLKKQLRAAITELLKKREGGGAYRYTHRNAV